MTVRDKIAWMNRGAALALVLSVGALLATILVFLGHAAEWIVRGSISHLTLADVTGLQGAIGRVPICFLTPVLAFVAFYAFFGLWNGAVQKDIDAHPNR